MENFEQDLRKYRQDILKNFIQYVLEIEPEEASQNALDIENVISDKVATKLIHFMDCMLQVSSNKNCSKNSQCGSCCSKCNCDK